LPILPINSNLGWGHFFDEICNQYMRVISWYGFFPGGLGVASTTQVPTPKLTFGILTPPSSNILWSISHSITPAPLPPKPKPQICPIDSLELTNILLHSIIGFRQSAKGSCKFGVGRSGAVAFQD
jgi:hypothetical protein